MEIRQKILSELRKIEKEENVLIFYACESGSRGWGFESVDSDYDVRFFYLHRLDWYLSIQKRRDVIERPISDDLDISGWDIRKMLQLFHKSNASLLEKLQSPIVYIERFDITDKIRTLIPDFFSPDICMYHYLNLANSTYKNECVDKKHSVKKIFYVLRPLLACLWLESQNSPAHMEFEKLVDCTVKDDDLLKEIDELLTIKKSSKEADICPNLHVIDSFIREELERLSQLQVVVKRHRSNPMLLDELYHQALAKVWGITI